MKLFRSLLVAPAAIGLLAPISTSASEGFLNEISNWPENTEHHFSDNLPIEMEIFEPIREIKNRHKCITMPFEATYKSIDLKENQEINQGIQNVSQTK